MKSSAQIVSSVVIRNHQIIVDGIVVFEKKTDNTLDFLHAAYDYFNIVYPKFYKMDNLCKTGFIAGEILLRKNTGDLSLEPEQVGIVISNANSSLDTDMRYEKSIATMPSPALFVYTLPNVLIGELCIRHKIKGESACFVFDIFDSQFQTNYVDLLFENGYIKKCISGWADFRDNNAEAFFYVAQTNSNEKSHPEHNSLTIQNLFN